MRRVSVWILYSRPDHVGRGAIARSAGGDEGRRNSRSDERQYLPLRRLSQYCGGGAAVPIAEVLIMRDFAYTPVRDIDHAIASSQRPNARFVAGGTCLVDLMKLDVE